MDMSVRIRCRLGEGKEFEEKKEKEETRKPGHSWSFACSSLNFDPRILCQANGLFNGLLQRGLVILIIINVCEMSNKDQMNF